MVRSKAETFEPVTMGHKLVSDEARLLDLRGRFGSYVHKR